MARKKQITNIEDLNLMRPDEIKEYLDQYVIGQDEAKRVLSVAVYNHYKRIIFNKNGGNKSATSIDKTNCMIVGQSGGGKTFMIKKIAELLNVPIYICDTSKLTQSGYVGSDVEDCIVGLLRSCDYNIEATQLGICVLDEVCKIRSVSAGPSITRDVGGQGVQEAMLKMVEGDIVGCPPAGGRKHPEQSLIYVDTTNILFIGLGAFVGLEDIVRKRLGGNKKVGFITKEKTEEETNYLDYVTPQDLKEFGFIPEFIGRFPVLTHVNKLDKDALLSILTKPKNSLIKQYTELIAMDGLKLKFENEALKEIADLAYEMETGARGLKSIMETVMMDVMYDAPRLAKEGIKVYTVTSDMINKSTKEKFKNIKKAA